MCFWFRKHKAKAEVKKSKYFYCKTFNALPEGTIFNVAGRTYKKKERNWLLPVAVDLETNEEIRLNPDILCIVYLEAK